MLALNKFDHYYPKLATRILGFMRKCCYENKPVKIDDLKEKFIKSSSAISLNLKILIKDGLIHRQFVGNQHLNGPRVKLFITDDGLLNATLKILEIPVFRHLH